MSTQAAAPAVTLAGAAAHSKLSARDCLDRMQISTPDLCVYRIVAAMESSVTAILTISLGGVFAAVIVSMLGMAK